MKKNNVLFVAALSIAVVASSCKKEEINIPAENNGNGKVSVIVSLGDESKGFSDTEGITWEVGDQIKYAGGVELTSDPLTEEQISDNGYTASFTFDASLIETDRTGWFVSTKCHPSNYTEVEFTLGADNGNLITQDEAGKMNSRYLFLHSGTTTTTITKDVEPVVKMDIAGSIFRVIPYTTTYNDEQVLSVKFESNDKVVGTVGYDRGAGTYKSVTDVNWKTYTYVKVDLSTPFSLTDVTSAETSKGIYFAVAATKADAPLNGYKYVVKTDKATYTFDAMNKTLAVGENVVKNVYLNLDKGTRVEGEIEYLKYDGALTLTTIPAEGCTDLDAGYWQASTSPTGEDPWTVRINSENSAFYSNVQFTYADATTGEPVDWISVEYGGGDLCHWRVTAEANTGEERSVKVTATYSDIKGYEVIGASKTKEWTFTQKAAGSNKVLTFFGGIGDQTIEATGVENKDLGYCVIDVDGVHAEDWAGDSHNEDLLYGNVTITPYVFGTGVGAGATVADWLTLGYGKDAEGNFNSTHIFVTAQDNTGAERKALVYCEYVAPEGYEYQGGEKTVYKQFIVTQKVGLTVEATLSNVYAETVPAAGATITAATLALTVNEEAQVDVSAALSTYGISVSADKGATASVAADGTVTLTVPENKYKNGGVTYTLTVKSNSNATLASATINQAEGTEEFTGNVYSYTISEVTHADGGVIGFPVSFDDKGKYFTFTDVKVNGETVELTDEIVSGLIASAFVPSDDRPAEGYDSYTYASARQIYIKATVVNNSEINFAPCTTADSKGYCCTINLMNSDGTKNRSVFYFVP
ncbi:MAG: hypothetical protein ACI3ZK_03890 [Candidatus Cryptobacteroides sp.]